METIRAELPAARVVFGREQFKSRLFPGGELVAPGHDAVKLGIAGNLAEKKLLQRAGNPVGGDVRRTEGGGKQPLIILVRRYFCDGMLERFVHLDWILN